MKFTGMAANPAQLPGGEAGVGDEEGLVLTEKFRSGRTMVGHCGGFAHRIGGFVRSGGEMRVSRGIACPLLLLESLGLQDVMTRQGHGL